MIFLIRTTQNFSFMKTNKFFYQLPSAVRCRLSAVILSLSNDVGKLFKVALLVSFLNTSNLISQTYDNELWSGIGIDLPITKDLELSLEQEIRLANDMEIVDWNISDIGLSYSFNKKLKISSSYNYRSSKDRWQHVFNTNIYYDNKYKKIKYTYRLRYQEKYKYKFEWNNEGEKRIEEGFESHIRNRIMFVYNTDMWLKPFTGFELYYLLGHADYPKKIKVQGSDKIYINRYSDRFDVLRMYLGVDIDTFKDQKLTLYYMSEHEFNIEEPNISNVIGVFYSFDLPRLF